jgi:tungstate transport system substrate-binding protein
MRALEDRLVANGFGINCRDMMYNNFVVIGPANDPADLRHAANSADAFRRVASKRPLLISRGVDSGAEQKEKEMWSTVRLPPAGSQSASDRCKRTTAHEF